MTTIHANNNPSSYSLIEGKKIKETDKAIYLEDSLLNRRWFPKSQIRHEEGDIYRIPRWMANDPDLGFQIWERHPK